MYICSELYIHVCLDASIEVSEELVESIFSSNEIMVCDADKLVFVSYFSFYISVWKENVD